MDVFDLVAKIFLDTDEYERSLNQAADKTDSFSSKLKSGLSTAAKVGAAALSGLATASVAIGTVAINNYAEYEQLTGGVETLFKTSADVVRGYADEAYKTAGLSANEYMDTVTSFSASLLQGLDGDTEKAAQVANRAITDMSDNANKMGTDMTMIQNAYQGFAKQNYTMLDNLKLGYGGTQAEMARLINDSGVLGDSMTVTAETVNQVSFDQIIAAIGVVQDQMGITGTTAKEAATTISGSISSMQSAWQNLLTGLADEDADLEQLVGNLVETATIAAGNLVPRIAIVAENVAGALLDTFLENFPNIVATGVEMIVKLATGIISAIPDLVAKIPAVVGAVLDGINEAFPSIYEVGKYLIEGLWQGIASMGSWIGGKLSGFIGGLIGTAKDDLGIHSPSTVFAGIGENMALGLGEGWDSEYNRIKRQIDGGLQFGTASVDFASSGLGMASAGIVNGVGSAVSGGADMGGVTTVNLVMGDGTKLASWQLPYLIKTASANGTPIASGQMA